MNVAEYVAAFLSDRGVRHVFGYQGGAILKLVDAMVATEQISFIQNYHEQGAGFCADGYSRITGNIGVALATSGPGATNLVTAIANAQFDSIPTLFITGQDYRSNALKRSGARLHGFQDLDIVSVAGPLTKYASMLVEPSEVGPKLEAAFRSATEGRPGAALLDIPIDLQFAECETFQPRLWQPPPVLKPAESSIRQVVELMETAEKPLLLVGGGVRLSRTETLVERIVQMTGIPVICTLNGLDVIPDNYGFAGLYGNTEANLAAQHADLMIVLGARLGQRQVGKEPRKYTAARVVHVDIDAAELSRVFTDELSIRADLGGFLSSLEVALHGAVLPCFEGWHERIRDWRRRYHTNRFVNHTGVDPVLVAERITSAGGERTVFVNDVGQNQMWVAQAFRTAYGQRLLNSVGLGSMGFSLPAAIGAHFADSSKNVVAFMGDGGFQINLQELMLIGLRKLPIKVVVFNNRTMGMIREVQVRYYDSNFHGANPDEFECVNLRLIAEAYGLDYHEWVDEVGEVELRELLNSPRPCIIEVPLDLDSQVTNRYDEESCFEAER